MIYYNIYFIDGDMKDTDSFSEVVEYVSCGDVSSVVRRTVRPKNEGIDEIYNQRVDYHDLSAEETKILMEEWS